MGIGRPAREGVRRIQDIRDEDEDDEKEEDEDLERHLQSSAHHNAPDHR